MPEILPGIFVSEYEAAVATAEDDAAACSFSRNLAAQSGGPRIRAIVLLGERPNTIDPRVLTRYPQLVIYMSQMTALACAAPEHWEAFLVLNPCGSHVGLYRRSDHNFQIQPLSASRPEDLATAERLLGVNRWMISDSKLLQRLPAGANREILRATSTDLAWGAANCALKLVGREGLQHEFSRSSIRVERIVEYSVLRPNRAVFDVEELSLSVALGSRPALFVSDLNVARIYGESWRKYAARHLHLVGELQLDLNESSKTWAQTYDICGCALKCGLPRDGVIVGIGGGIALDLAGFAAAIFRRGVGFIRIPTSLIGLVDVSVGIKQGINSHGAKNLLGSFYPPILSINDYRFLESLPPAELSSGMAEILKMALARDRRLFELLERNGRQLVASCFRFPSNTATEVLLRAELLMMEELAPNLFETERTRLVDLGHTFSPAIETASAFKVPHGQAVVLDILLSTAVVTVLGRTPLSFLKRIASLVKSLGLPIWDDLVPSGLVLFNSLREVERHRGGSLNLIAATDIARPEMLQAITLSQLEAAISLLRNIHVTSNLPTPSFGTQAYARTSI